MSSITHTVVTTCTRDCPNACGLLARVEDGRVTALHGNPAHPLTGGAICGKCPSYLARAYSPQRILHPLKRTGGEWFRISWDEALDEIAEAMRDTIDRYGPEAILYYRGFAQRSALKLINERFFNLLGGVTGTRGTLCGGTGQAAQELDFGKRISHDPLDHLNSRTLIIWGRNPAATNPYLTVIMKQVRQRGGRVILVDPVASETGKMADLHIQPRPGTDRFLALAAARLILGWGREDRSFLESRTDGFPAFRAMIDANPVAEYAAWCDVAEPVIEELARTLTEDSPCAIILGWGLHRWEQGHETIRAIDALAAVAGIIGIPGGGVSQGFDEYAPYDLSLTGDGMHPHRRRLLMPLIGQEILDATEPPIRMAFVTAGNPVCQAPNAAKVTQAFTGIPFLVVVGHFLDDTARLARIVLPTTTFLEEDDVTASYGHNYLGPITRAVEPPGECRSDLDILAGLAQRFDFADEFKRSREEWLQLLLAPVLAKGITLDDIMAGPVRIPDAPQVPYRNGIFMTDTTKFRFMEEVSAAPPPAEVPYPFHLLSVSPREWLGSELTPADRHTATEVRMHRDEAAARGIKDGDAVLVSSDVGTTTAVARLSDQERRDVVVFPRGRWITSGSSVNLLTRDLASRVGDGTPYYETRVDVVPL